MKRLINVVNKNGLEVEFPYEKPENLVKWAVKVMKAGGKDIDLNAAAMLVNYCEPGMTDILSELEKLKDFLGEKAKATVADVEAVCTKTVKGRVFDITDAIAENNCTKAFKLLNDMLTLREPAQKIYFMIARQLRQVFQAKLLSGRGMGTDEVAKEMGLHPFIAGKVLKQASRFTLAKLKEIIKAAHEMDVAVKTGKMGELTAIEILIIRMSE
jgi:DNA polymerase-3 subunit delta